MRLLLCTDLDRTLLPNGPQPESEQSRERFRLLVARQEVTLVYVTGRDRSLVLQAIKTYQIPQPDFVIADVGSSIYKISDGDGDGDWRHWQEWDEAIGQDWQGKTHADLKASLSGFRDLRLQEYSKQNKHKLSYYLPLYIDHIALIDKISSHLELQHIHANLVWSVDEQTSKGLLDILPASAGKRQAIEFLMQQLQFDLSETVFAGDSGNDISVMASPIHSVLVANASDDVRQHALQQAEANDQSDSLYIAQGGYLAMNGNYSAGILEGVVHYMPEVEKWLGDYNE